MLKKLRNLYYNIRNGLENLLIWLPVIWKDRDFDEYYVFKLLYKKFENMEKFFNSEFTWSADAKKMAQEIKIAKNLVKRIIDDNYLENALTEYHKKYGDLKYSFKQVEGQPNLVKLIWDETEESQKIFRRCSKHSNYMKKQDLEYLFNYLNKNISKWWD